jgi:hypothetical protein
MKKLVSLVLVFILFLPAAAQAEPADFSGGVHDEYEYQELVFVSGEPVMFSGTVKITDSSRNDSRTLRYTFDLASDDLELAGELSRNMSYTITYNVRADKSQTVAGMVLKSYKEKIELSGVEYELDDMQFSKSDITDNRAASDFSSGTMTAKKIYRINDTEGRVVVDINGGTVGYENFWGITQTQLLDYYITSQRKTEADDYSWEGSVRVTTSDSLIKTLRYAVNESSLSSFPGGNMKVTEQGIYSRYDYDLPTLYQDNDTGGAAEPDNSRRNQGSQELSKERMPLVERLILPKFRDVGGHWAQDAINQLYSCDVFTGDTEFFVPDVAMTRGDFTVAIIQACNIRANVDPNQRSSRSSKTVEISPFVDLPTSDPDYAAIKIALDKNIVAGFSEGVFGKERSLTRAQAVTILIRALGFENQAPTPGYYAGFADDSALPNWAQNSIYMARQIGLVEGDAYNRFNPDQALTRAEASVLLVKFLSFLQSDLQKDYRDYITMYR